MRNSHSNKQVSVLGIAVLVLVGCASLFNGVPAPKLGTFSQEELNEAKRIRNDPRLYGVRLDPEQYARYLSVIE